MASSTAVMWFRRDLRLHDNPALLEALSAGEVLPLFVLDPVLWDRSGPVRRSYLAASLRALDASMGGALVVRRGDPVEDLALAGRGEGRFRVQRCTVVPMLGLGRGLHQQVAAGRLRLSEQREDRLQLGARLDHPIDRHAHATRPAGRSGRPEPLQEITRTRHRSPPPSAEPDSTMDRAPGHG